MSCELFRQRLSRVQVHPNDLQWMPIWLDRYAEWAGASEGMMLTVTHERVLCFLRWLRDSGVSAWQPLQAARAVQWHQSLVLRSAEVDFSLFKQKLGELAVTSRLAAG